MAWLSQPQLQALGFARLGSDVLISERAAVYGCSDIQIGSHVRIDDFCVLSAGRGCILVGDYVHIAVHCALMGRETIELGDFAGLSSRVSIYSSSDDYSGGALTNPTVPEDFRAVTHARVKLGKHVIVGAGSVVLPGVSLGDGVAVGALSLVTKNCEEFGTYLGVPAKRIGTRRRDLLDLEERLRSRHA